MESVAVSDHFQPWRHEGGHAPFSLAWLAAVGERTSSITIGTSVMTPTFRYNPAVLAQAFATLGVLYPGRVFLGVGRTLGPDANLEAGYLNQFLGQRNGRVFEFNSTFLVSFTNRFSLRKNAGK